jgi:hypothetical protein
MARDDPKTPFPFPDLPPAFAPFPDHVGLDTPIADLSGWWLEVRCDCPEAATAAFLPLRLLAARLGWDVPLGSVVRRLKCEKCGQPPLVLDLIESATGGASNGQKEPKRIHLPHRAG